MSRSATFTIEITLKEKIVHIVIFFGRQSQEDLHITGELVWDVTSKLYPLEEVHEKRSAR